MISGNTENSRLVELKKYAIGVSFAQQYISGGTWTTNGVDYNISESIEYVVYYIDGIQFIDKTLIDGGILTTFNYYPNNENNFIDVPYIKNQNKSKIVSNPKINDDVFIVRNNLSVFDKNYRLEYIRNLKDLTTYVGGKYFNIINNS